MPMYYGFKQHTHGRYFHFNLGVNGFLHRFNSAEERLEWLGDNELSPDYPKFIVKSTDLVRVKEGIRGNHVQMIHQIKGL